MKVSRLRTLATTRKKNEKVSSAVRNVLTLNVLYHTIPYQLCGCEVKDVHGLQSFVSTHSEESDSWLFILCLQQQMFLSSAFSKQNFKITPAEFSPLYIICTKNFSMSCGKPTGCGTILNFIQINCKIFKKMDSIFFYFSYNCNLKVKVIQTHFKMYSIVVPIIIPSLKETGL